MVASPGTTLTSTSRFTIAAGGTGRGAGAATLGGGGGSDATGTPTDADGVCAGLLVVRATITMAMTATNVPTTPTVRASGQRREPIARGGEAGIGGAIAPAERK